MKKIIISGILSFVLLLCACSNHKTFDNVALIGDSMTWYGGDNFELERGWTHHFKRDANPTSLTLYARSGATWTNTANTAIDTEFYTGRLNDTNVVYNQVMRMIKAKQENTAPTPDLIIMYVGINDVMYSDSRPGLYDISAEEALAAEPFAEGTHPSSVTTLAGSIRLNCDLLRQHFPNARIVLMTPLEVTVNSVEEVTRAADIIEAMGRGLGLEVIRGDKDVNIRHEVEKQQYTYTCDGIHTNPAGARLISEFIISSLK